MSKNRVVTDQSSNSMPPVSRQNSPQHKMCLPRNKVLQNAKTVNPQQQVQIPIYLNEAQLALLNSKHSSKEASRQFITEQGKTTITTAKSATSSATVPSTLYQQQQQFLAQHLHQHQTHNYLHQVVVSNPDGGEHPTGNPSGTAVSYLIAPNLLVSHNQLSQLTPRDLAILQQKLLHQQHIYQHQQQQQQMQAGSSSNQHLMCTCPSELHRAMHVQQQQQQQQQQQRLLEQRKLLAAQLSAMHGGPQIKFAPVTASTLPRDQHSSTHHIHPSKSDGQSIVTAISQGHLCQNHQLSFLRHIEGVDNGAAVTSLVDSSDNILKEAHVCSLNSSGDSGYSSTRDQQSVEVDSQISNLISWIESVYGIKLVDYISKNYSVQSQGNTKNGCDGSYEINGNELNNCSDPQRIRTTLKDLRDELDDVQAMVRRQADFVKDSLNQISNFIQSQSSQNISEKVKLFEYNQAVLAHKIQTVHTTLSSYLSSEDKYQPDVINNISRNVSDINDDYSKLQDNYMLIERPVKFNMEQSSNNIDRHQNIIAMVGKAMISSQGQLNTLNYTMADLIRKQALIKPPKKVVSLPEEAMESVVALRRELHGAILAMTPDLEKRQMAYELLERFLQEKHQVPQLPEAQGNFEDIVDANLSGIDDLTPTLEESPEFRNYNEMSSSAIDDDNLPPPPPIESVEDSPVPINMTDHLSHIDMTSESIPMIDETPSSESFDDVSFNEPTVILLTSNMLKKLGNVEDDCPLDSRPLQKTSTILKTSSGLKTSKTNKVVFCDTVTVEDGSETIRLNCPSEESDSDEMQNNLICSDDQGTLKKNPPPPPPRRTSQVSSGIDNPECDINYENLDSFSSDMRHHILHHNLVCVPLASKGSSNHSTTEGTEKRRVDAINLKMVKVKSATSPSENDVWQRQTEFNTLSSRHGQAAAAVPPGKTGAKNPDPKIKAEKPNKKK